LTTLDARCVYCRHNPADPAWRPFCSERCKMADLGRWLTGGYSVPAEPAADDDAPDMTSDARDTDDHR
jgi:uncharacterized protein